MQGCHPADQWPQVRLRKACSVPRSSSGLEKQRAGGSHRSTGCSPISGKEVSAFQMETRKRLLLESRTNRSTNYSSGSAPSASWPSGEKGEHRAARAPSLLPLSPCGVEGLCRTDRLRETGSQAPGGIPYTSNLWGSSLPTYSHPPSCQSRAEPWATHFCPALGTPELS